jgi:excisionase family DNA binding protein
VSAAGIEQHYTTSQLAMWLSVHPETIRRAARRGDLFSVPIGNERRYPESAVQKWLQSRVDKRDAT